MLVARYQVRLKNPAGSQVGIFDAWRSLQFQDKVNDGGFFSLSLDAYDPRIPLFELDGQIEIWRSIPGVLAWYKVFEANIEDFYDSLFENGNRQFVMVGTGYTGLLGRRTIAYASDTAYAAKSGVAETVMKAYVNENIGPGATSPPRLRESGVMAGMMVEANSALGGMWTGCKHEQNLLDTLQGIANVGALDFAVVGTGAATYQFKTYTTQRGIDRTTIGLNPTTGMNAAGNLPVIFSPAAGNVSQMEYKVLHKSEVNAVFVWGKGTGSARAVRLRTDPVAIGASPIGLREASRSGASQILNTELDGLADTALVKDQTKEVLTFTPKQTAQSLFGVHYDVGDRVTANYFGHEFHKRLTAATPTVSAGGPGESLDLDFQDIP